jgi:hypothetical protein
MARELQVILDSGEVTDIKIGGTAAGDSVTKKTYVDAQLLLKQDAADLETDVETILAAGVASIKVGDVAGGDYTEIKADGTIQCHGAATAWDDQTFPLIAYRLEATTGTLAYNYANNSITMSASGTIGDDPDTLTFTSQIPHKAKANSDCHLHIHWEQPADQAYTFDVRYRIQENGSAKTASWSTTETITMTGNKFTYVSGTLIQITELLVISLSGLNPSDLIQVQMTRSDATSGDIEAIAVDFHYEIDMLGSSSEYTK